MKKLGFVICLIFVVCVVCVMLLKPNSNVVQQMDEIDMFLKMQSTPPVMTDVQTTQELKNLLGAYSYAQTPRIYVRRFPADFATNGDRDTFMRTLLPHVLRQNELLKAERALFLKLANKANKKEQLTQKELGFIQSLVLKYEVIAPDFISQINALYHKVDRISPSVALVQAMDETQNMTQMLDAPFGVFRWNKQKEYARVQYPDLASATADYALEINRGTSYHEYHSKRSIYRDSHYELPGEALVDGLSFYKRKDTEYVRKLKQLLDDFNNYDIDNAKLKKGE